MQNFVVKLASEPSRSFRCTKAANALDIDVEKKLTHELDVSLDLSSPYKVGLIVGASGSGKTSLARLIFGREFDAPVLDLAKPAIDQFPEAWSYDQCAQALTGMGLSAVTCWIRPAGSLSNGQRARAEAALRLADDSDKPVVIDEWTSVVDRTVAKAMSTCLVKHARRSGRRVVLLSCHYDIVDWLEPDWVLVSVESAGKIPCAETILALISAFVAGIRANEFKRNRVLRTVRIRNTVRGSSFSWGGARQGERH